jgi:uncharacterized protein
MAYWINWLENYYNATEEVTIMFFRWVVLLFILWLTWQVARRLWREHQKKQVNTDPTPRELPAKRMLRCAHCGVHFPEQEAVYSEKDVFCCSEHQRQYVEKSFH